jgi:hypothetical protein
MHRPATLATAVVLGVGAAVGIAACGSDDTTTITEPTAPGAATTSAPTTTTGSTTTTTSTTSTDTGGLDDSGTDDNGSGGTGY